MSMTINNQEDFHRARRLVWGQLFGIFIKKGRETRGRSLEEAARRAGMEPAEWQAAEEGHVPATAAELRSMAEALEFSKVQLATAVQICRVAWEA